MTEFLTAVDIGNRACQHCGVTRIDPTLGFTEDSRQASEISFVYGKLRRAELQRNNWKFAIRRTALRPIETNTTNNTDTLLLVPAMWVSTTTYFVGSIVADQFGTLWQSNIPNNLNNQPLISTTWDEYFGPMAVAAWDTTGTTSYFAGELVYTAAGDGTNRVYVSLLEGNSDNPATGTAWISTSTYYKNQIVTFSSVAYMSLIDLNVNNEPDLAPALWAVGTTYAAGAHVGGSDGVIYQSIGSGNVGNDPTLDGGVHWTNTGVLNPWTTVFVSGAGSLNWRQIGGAGVSDGRHCRASQYHLSPRRRSILSSQHAKCLSFACGLSPKIAAGPQGWIAILAWCTKRTSIRRLEYRRQIHDLVPIGRDNASFCGRYYRCDDLR